MDLEKSLLGKVTSSDAMQYCWDHGLRAEVFEDPLCKIVYTFAVDYWMRENLKMAPTKEVLEHEFARQNFAVERSDESLEWLVSKLKTRYLSNITQEVMREAAELSVESPADAMNVLYNQSWKAKQATQPRFNRVNMSATIQDRRIRYSEKQQTQERGAPIGLEEVDEHTNGILPGELAIVAGYAKTGKSFKLVNAAVKARKAGWTPCVFTLEQGIDEFEDRIDAFASGVGYGKLQRGQLTMDESRRLHAAQEEMAELGPLHLERPEKGDRTVASMVNRARQIGADYLIIDQLSWMESIQRYRDRRDEYKELIGDLKEEISRASAGEISTFMAVQYNRQAVSTKGERGGMHNIANSADVEQMVDIAYGLYRNKEIRANDSMVLDILGARRSDNASWLLGWHLNNQSSIFVRERYEEDEE
ncbi:dsDNA helicase [Rhodococcus phage Finch]|uniref:DnaB-like dsDNA helicase n=1 Tax=Rhodococcus phage Finch TaxID=2094144 RepID=A0A2P1JXY3_9CAUD|nr:dsDNA helicase [Rhodococcus phage Finch]AVO25178.1 DnaB-like dsDNA helicase [Rhodococcus phage Finch]